MATDFYNCTICQSTPNVATILPCKHAFCSRCIRKYINHQPEDFFKCPNCRNVYQKDDEILDTLSTNVLAFLNETEFDISHNDFPKDLPFKTKGCNDDASNSCESDIKSEIDDFVLRIDCTLRSQIESLKLALRHVNGVNEKFSEAETAVCDRFEVIVKTAKKCRDISLERLKEIKNKCNKLQSEVERRQSVAHKLANKRQKLIEAVRHETAICLDEIISEQFELETEELIYELPVLCCSVNLKDIQADIQGFIGVADTATMKTVRSELTAKVQFDRDSVSESFCDIRTVYSAAKDKNETGEGAVAVYCLSEDLSRIVRIASTGEELCRVDEKPTKDTHIKRFEDGKLLRPIPCEGKKSSFSKSTKTVHFQLQSGTDRKGEIWHLDSKTNSHTKANNKPVLRIVCGRPRAFDVSADRSVFVVLEEAESSKERSIVKMFRKKSKYPVATYQPPGEKFKPSDLCFYWLGGKQVLLVADEATDTIHVVDVQKDRLVFLRYLALDPGLLFQPAILHVDFSNGLWVANRSGNLLALQPSPQAEKTESRADVPSTMNTSCNKKSARWPKALCCISK